MKFVRLSLPNKQDAQGLKSVCENRSAAQWRDLRFAFPFLTHALKPKVFSILYGPTKVVP
jgi:hypothetical protein